MKNFAGSLAMSSPTLLIIVAVQVVRDHLTDVDRAVPGAAHAKTLIGTAGTAWTMGAIELGIYLLLGVKVQPGFVMEGVTADLVTGRRDAAQRGVIGLDRSVYGGGKVGSMVNTSAGRLMAA